ncbi:MAG: DNRLRE domain-containing protein [PVC group bacterium]
MKRFEALLLGSLFLLLLALFPAPAPATDPLYVEDLENLTTNIPPDLGIEMQIYGYTSVTELGSWYQGNFHDGEALDSPEPVSIWLYGEPLVLYAGRTLTLQYDGGRISVVYLPTRFPEDSWEIELFVAEDGATYYNREMTSPAHGAYDSDLDDDGMDDGWEEENGLDPGYSGDGELDSDGDGLSNLDEFIYGLDPHNPDQDGDGLLDGWELDHELDPQNPEDGSEDTDGDGLTVYEEVELELDIWDIDTDNDGYQDGLEALYLGTDPADKNSKPHTVPAVLIVAEDSFYDNPSLGRWANHVRLFSQYKKVYTIRYLGENKQQLQDRIRNLYITYITGAGQEEIKGIILVGRGIPHFEVNECWPGYSGEGSTDHMYGNLFGEKWNDENGDGIHHMSDERPSKYYFLEAWVSRYATYNCNDSISGSVFDRYGRNRLLSDYIVQDSADGYFVHDTTDADWSCVTSRYFAAAFDSITSFLGASTQATAYSYYQRRSHAFLYSAHGTPTYCGEFGYDEAYFHGSGNEWPKLVLYAGCGCGDWADGGNYSLVMNTINSETSRPAAAMGSPLIHSWDLFTIRSPDAGRFWSLIDYYAYIGESTIRRFNFSMAYGDPGAIFNIIGDGSLQVGKSADVPLDGDGDGLADIGEEILGFDPSLRDSNGDGVSDLNELLGKVSYYLSFDNPKLDSDRDGWPDEAEYKYDSDPYNSLSWPTSAADWEDYFGGSHIWGEDPDSDGLSNQTEFDKGTNPLRADSDGDGLTDGEELYNTHTDPVNPDTDSDGLNDNQEIQHETDPFSPDSDQDGVGDGQEVADGTDPNDPDSCIPSDSEHYPSQILSPMQDAYVSSYTPSTPFGRVDPSLLKIKTGIYGSMRTLIQFDFSGFSNSSRLSQAILCLKETGDVWDGTPLEISAHLLSGGPWGENTVTWKNQPGFINNPMITPTLHATVNRGGTLTLDITAWVKAWIDSPSSNHGLLLKGRVEGSLLAEKHFASSDSAPHQVELLIYANDSEDSGRDMDVDGIVDGPDQSVTKPDGVVKQPLGVPDINGSDLTRRIEENITRQQEVAIQPKTLTTAASVPAVTTSIKTNTTSSSGTEKQLSSGARLTQVIVR